MIRLAVDGGSPVRTSLLPYGRHHIDEADIKEVVAVLRSNWLTTGPTVEVFERGIADYVGAKHSVAVSSGTAALHASIAAADIDVGDEVIVPALTFAASANCALYLGAKPVFADVQPETLNVDVIDIERKITSRTKAIVVVDYAGQPADHAAISDIARSNGLVVIDDAAHSLGATYDGKKIGVLHDMTTFSFHPVKHITTGEGGMVVTDDQLLASKIRSFRNHGIDHDLHSRAQTGLWTYRMERLGYNYRLSDLNCALGFSQISTLNSMILRRRRIASTYMSALARLPAIQLPVISPKAESSWHLFVIRLVLERLRVGRAEIFAALRAENIGVNVHYMPVYWHPYYESLGYERGLCPVSEDAYERMITLPLFPTMSDKDVHDVVYACEKVIGAYSR